MAETEQDRSEKPTPYKLERSRQKGMVARGLDLGFFASLAAAFGYAWIAGPSLARAIEQAAHDALVSAPALASGDAALLPATAVVFSSIVRPMLLLFIVVFALVLLCEIVQTGFVFSAHPLKPDFTRLNPANGFKRVFSIRLLIETFKSVAKLLVYAGIAFLVIRAVAWSDMRSVADGRGLLETLLHGGVRLLSLMVLAAGFFMVLDQLLARGQFLKKMRMNRRELRQEAREREGEPRLKQRRKQLHREFARASRSLRGIKKADVLVTNPEHIAIGLHYRPGVSQAPMVVSMGINQLAQRLKRLAFLHGIPIVENKELARELYRRTALDGPVPEHCYRPVADIYNAIRRRASARNTERQDAA